MKLKKIIVFAFFLNFITQGVTMANPKITIKLKYGEVKEKKKKNNNKNKKNYSFCFFFKFHNPRSNNGKSKNYY